MSELPASRAEAKRIGSSHYFTGKPCKNGHIATRHTDSGRCLDCCAADSSRWRKENREKYRAQKREAYWASPEKRREGARKDYYRNLGERRAKARRWKKENPERHAKINRRWAKANPDYIRTNNREWQMANPEYMRARCAARRSRKKQAAPAFANQEYIRLFHRMAEAEAERLGCEVHVDHIVPLESPIVCGLHYEHNLQLMTAEANWAKGNEWWPNMPSEG